MPSRKRWTVLTVLLLTLVLLVSGCGKPGGKAKGTTDKAAAGTTKDKGWASGDSGDSSWEEEEDDQEDWDYVDESDDYDDPDQEDWASEDSNLYDYDLDKNGSYTSKDDVMNYLVQYHQLPGNFITKKEARSLGWSGGSLEPYAPGKCIGGDRFGNYEENLPVVKGRTYYECDIDTLGAKKRGAKRIVFSEDGSIYYTEDHYKTFELLYGDDAYEN